MEKKRVELGVALDCFFKGKRFKGEWFRVSIYRGNFVSRILEVLIGERYNGLAFKFDQDELYAPPQMAGEISTYRSMLLEMLGMDKSVLSFLTNKFRNNEDLDGAESTRL